MTDGATAPVLSGLSHVRPHPLRIRRDGEEWIVGRIETGTFIAIPEIGVQILEGMDARRSLEEIGRDLDTGVDVAGFVVQLIDLGLVAEVDGHALPQDPPPRPSLSWLRPHHVRWAVSLTIAVIVGCVVATAAGVLLLTPETFPSYRDLIWTRYHSLVLLSQIATTWGLIFCHELGHLITARAVGVPGRVRLGTRLQFLVAQTDVSGIWAVSRRHRLWVYAAGMAIDMTAAAVALVVMAVLRSSGVAVPFAFPMIVLTVATMAPLQFLVFMRTDVYFILQDLAGCRNLYSDGAAYLRHLASRFPHTRSERSAIRRVHTRAGRESPSGATRSCWRLAHWGAWSPPPRLLSPSPLFC